VRVVNVIASVALGIVFVVAGASKVAAGRAWPAQAAELGVPRPIAVAVPWFEMTLGALVAVGLGQPWPAAVALLTLLVFSCVLVRTLRSGRRPPCACFGTWTAAPLRWAHVTRNSAFAALALVAILTH
jgi:uncharacterized membrane protein YphA (DoxX/SURF4 family)